MIKASGWKDKYHGTVSWMYNAQSYFFPNLLASIPVSRRPRKFKL